MSGQQLHTGESLHKEYPKQFARTDFWRQIKRTVGGQPVSASDIQKIVAQLNRHLDFRRSDHLLDLGCGNGALASEFFGLLGRYTGVDFSEYLLGVAEQYFGADNKVAYIRSDIRKTDQYLASAQDATIVLIYGCIGYLQPPELRRLIAEIKTLPSLRSIFIGNIADRAKASEFYAARDLTEFDLDDAESAIGVWWDREAIVEACSSQGYSARCVDMPDGFYSSGYRFDLLIARQD